MKSKNKGFSLVELSIVIVVMGLLAALSVAGKELIRLAKVKSIISEVEAYKIASDNFKSQYNYLPGDLSNATSFWASTTNGDGNGAIGVTASNTGTEVFDAWQQLGLAKLIPASTLTGTGTVAVIGTNVPASQNIDAGGYSFTYKAPGGWLDQLSRSVTSNNLVLGSYNASYDWLWNPALDPEMAYMIDSKVDDGKPNFGKVMSDGSSTACTTVASGVYNASVSYSLSNQNKTCWMFFNLE
ncbi:prepilin-type N-terminal cleavage/methylation domain-containing protein [Rickettsiales bacterium]|nr:prepilin-type N-terminal cleavage/methylation domain-containing protein [Rickettsiales bacterium]